MKGSLWGTVGGVFSAVACMYGKMDMGLSRQLRQFGSVNEICLSSQ